MFEFSVLIAAGAVFLNLIFDEFKWFVDVLISKIYFFKASNLCYCIKYTFTGNYFSSFPSALLTWLTDVLQIFLYLLLVCRATGQPVSFVAQMTSETGVSSCIFVNVSPKVLHAVLYRMKTLRLKKIHVLLSIEKFE